MPAAELGRGGGGGREGGNKPGGWFLTAVSRVLSVTYLRPCRVGDELRIEAVRFSFLSSSPSSAFWVIRDSRVPPGEADAGYTLLTLCSPFCY